uniref:Lipocalin/cytosolic fatty-acid binding domain-containing protein n=1 Tax=Lotharella globosa TaxID=91324 RepID=A0A7S3Z387_9EUKA|mmetsp:Transcript_16857/g.31946  ORF Transcript_16857/g.31946 Transcript_16857/m.31946 type:complete len:353 (-) Transcript_16857:313-1371(-)|eukprot:CAMPEP_0167791410 /NCGR_PEP_ID=MMETSP0111_2-20121227/11927_1 /TAXON_ID=91324 /ORGANISM="Lotharella globosa, Strain CCCM811" /LENGTH=352 /DNA_ID=CAMNT_0007684089 /DNA_START=224 /DNA_END=1282 /DNA_ORIENTATION=-
MMLATTLFATAFAGPSCPGSKAFIHAKCSLTATFPSNTCEEVATEMIARINGENSWVDPHNGGVYTLTSGGASSAVLTTQRVTGNNKYTDLQKWTLNKEGNGCQVQACSESQVTSVIDYSTNYCDLHNLYCGTQDGCPVAHSDLKYTENFNSCSQNDKSKCVVKTAPAPQECKKVEVQQDFDLEKYIAQKWYIQQQQEVSYLPASQNYCVSAQYTAKSASIFGYTISVNNKAFEQDKSTKHEASICAAVADKNDPAKLEVAPCFLPKFAAGPYWVVAFNDEEGWALISGGQPTIQGTNGCKNGSGVNGSGLWIFTRQQARDDAIVQKVRNLAVDKGFDITVLNDVDQTNCPQ